MSQTPSNPPPQQYSPSYSSPPQDNPLATLIPYRNVCALVSYYLGIFSLLPILGAIMGPVAVILGIKGLSLASREPAAKGAVHAWVGIICGGLFGLLWIAVIVLIIIGIVARH